MKIRDKKKEITIYLNSNEMLHGKPLFKFLIDKFIELNITGCTMFKSTSGYGTDMKVKYPLEENDFISRLLLRESTIIITVVETPEKVEEAIKILDEYVPNGIVTIKDVDFIRYTKTLITEEDIKLADNTQL